MRFQLPPEPGQLVVVRNRHFVVTEIRKSTLPADPLHLPAPTLSTVENGNCQHLATLSSVEDEGLGDELQVIWEIEPGAHVYEKMELPEPVGFDEPRRLDAFLDAVRWGAVSSADVRALQSPFRSGIDIEDYQLDPVVRALQMPRVNLLVADDVGLGKTIEAGLVVQELILRHRARSILVVCPAPIQVQWRDQMRDKFGLEFRIVDSSLMKELRRRRGLHANPWTHFPRLITSIDFLKRERPLRLFRETLPAEGKISFPRRYDLLIIDEAHNVAPSGSGHYSIDSQRTVAVRMLAPHFEHKLFLTATPHNGYPESFTALLELLDNQRFARGTRPDPKQVEAVMVRRMKNELKRRWDGSPRFAERKLEALVIDHTDTERDAHRSLAEYARLRQQNTSGETEKFATEFVLKLLKKRLFSSPAAFATTLEKHEKSLVTPQKASGKKSSLPLSILQKQVDLADEEYADDDLYEETSGEAVDIASRVLSRLSPQEAQLLQNLREYAASAATRADTKAKALIAWLRQNIVSSEGWTDNRVLIFSEYRTTQKWLQGLLAAEGLTEKGRVELLYGGMASDERERIKAAFQASPQESPVRILLATDAASEGIDLQNHCSRLIHYEVPWNPNRMEQRNGRLDRHGQRAPEVHVYHFVSQGYEQQAGKAHIKPGNLEGDLEFLMRVVRKVETIREDLGKVGPVIARQIEEAMLGRRSELDTAKAEAKAEPVRRMLRFERDLRERIEKLHLQLQESKQELRLSAENIQSVVEVGLELAGHPPLKETAVAGLWPDSSGAIKTCPVFEVPPLTGSWAECHRGLAHPHTQKVRPILFDHSLASGRDDVVLAHLNHRLVQMCLRLLRAEIWSGSAGKRLYRVAARLAPNSALDSPAIIAHARLVVLGGDNQRLHEEVIMAGGRIREGRFVRMNIGETRAAFAAGLSADAPDSIKRRLQELWPTHSRSLLQALEARMIERAKGLQKFLDDRAAREINDMKSILQELEQNIRKEVSQPVQLTMYGSWSKAEQDQYERNRNSLKMRLAAIPVEIERETEATLARYRVPVPHMFPVAVSYFIPEKLTRQI